jgi:uncharacterized protein
MRRKDKEIKDRKVIDSIIKRCRICHLAMSDDDQPYIVPLHFGYDGDFLYFHTAPEGKKIDIIKKNDKVCFEFDILHDIVEAGQPCQWGTKYESVLGSGTAEIIDDFAAKKAALELIMRQYGSDASDFPEEVVKKTLIFRLRIREISGKAQC